MSYSSFKKDKLLMENWRRFLSEGAQNLSPKTLNLLPVLINMKKFKNVEDFLGRTQFIKSGDDAGVQYILKIDNKVVGTVEYGRLEDYENCRPSYSSGEQPKATMMLATIAREQGYRGWGVGRLLSFLSACDVSNMGMSITSDRNTSDKAGKQLVANLKMMGAKTSGPFDYVGWFINTVKRSYDVYGDGDFDIPFSVDSGREGVKGEKETNRMRAKIKKEYVPKVQKLIQHLKPLTPQKDDDCEPSANIVIGDGDIRRMIRGPKFIELIDKFLKMSSEEVNDLFDSDKRVQGYTFMMPKIMLNTAAEIIKAIDVTSGLSDDDLSATVSQADDVFRKTYDKEIGADGRAIAQQ